MHEHGSAGHSRRTGRRSLTHADRKAAPAPDLIGRDFTAPTPGLRVVGDITYVPTAEGWLYLATWLDLATREVIGYSMADHHRADLVVDALDMPPGWATWRTAASSTPTADRREHTSAQFRKRLGELGLRQSMGRTGICFDNAAAESFFAVLKEEIGTRIWDDRASARADIFTFIATYYNHRRLRRHPQWGYLTLTKPASATTERNQTHVLDA